MRGELRRMGRLEVREEGGIIASNQLIITRPERKTKRTAVEQWLFRCTKELQ